MSLIVSFLLSFLDSETRHRCSVVVLIFNSMDKCKTQGGGNLTNHVFCLAFAIAS